MREANGASRERSVSSTFDVARRRSKNRSARSYRRPADAVVMDGVSRISRWVFSSRATDEKISFRASSVPRGSRGDGGRGGGAGARAKRASGDGCARVADTSCASPRGRARDDARACASRPPRATPEKNRGTETSMRAKRRGDGRGPWDFHRGLLPRVERGDAPRAQAGRGRRTFVCLGNNSRPSSSKSSLPLIARSGAYRDKRRGEPNVGDCVSVAFAFVVCSFLFSG